MKTYDLFHKFYFCLYLYFTFKDWPIDVLFKDAQPRKGI